MLTISNFVKEQFAFIDRVVGIVSIEQAVRTAKESRDTLVSLLSSVEQKQKDIVQVIFTRGCYTEHFEKENALTQVLVIMRRNPADKDLKCSAKEIYTFDWDESEKKWILKDITEWDQHGEKWIP